MVHISNKLGGLNFILSMGTQFNIFGCWGGFLHFPLFQRKIVWVQIKSNQSKISRNWTDIMWVFNCQYEPFYPWIFQFKILPFYHSTFLQQTSLGFYLSLHHHIICYGGFTESSFNFGQSSENCIKYCLISQGGILTKSPLEENCETCLVLILIPKYEI